MTISKQLREAREEYAQFVARINRTTDREIQEAEFRAMIDAALAMVKGEK